MHEYEAVFCNLSVHLRSVSHKKLCLLAQNSPICWKEPQRVAGKWHLSSVAACRVNLLLSWSLLRASLKWWGCRCFLGKQGLPKGSLMLHPVSFWRGCLWIQDALNSFAVEPLLLLRGLHSGKRLQALFSLQRNSSKIRFVLECGACGKRVSSFLDSASEEICLPVWFSERAYAECLNAKVYNCSAFWHIILTLVVADGCFVCLNLQPVVISLHCPVRQTESRDCHLHGFHPAGLQSWLCAQLCWKHWRGLSGAWHRTSDFPAAPVCSSRVYFVAAHVDATSRAGLVENGHRGVFLCNSSQFNQRCFTLHDSLQALVTSFCTLIRLY